MPVLQRIGGQLLFSARAFMENWFPITVWGLFLILVELFGRFSWNDMTDLGLAILVAMWTMTIHAARPLPPVSAMQRACAAIYQKFVLPNIQIGADLRGEPAIARRFPRSMLRFALVLFSLNIGVACTRSLVPTGCREFLTGYFYLGYLALISCLWFCIIFIGMFLFVVASMSIHDLFVMSFRGQGKRPQKKERLVITTLSLALFVAAMLLPAIVPILFVLTMQLMATCSLLMTSRGLNLLWRTSAGTPVYSMDGRWYLLCVMSSFFLLVTLVIQLSMGELLVNPSIAGATSRAPLTLAMGQVFGWLAVPGTAMALFHVLRFAWLGIDFNPERDKLRFQRDFKGNVRQWEIAQRRALVRGLRTLFKRKARLNPSLGTGVWIGVQHWFVLGLSRDVDQDDPEATKLDHVIGPPYHRLFARDTRLHYWEITNALQVDLILVEDGITFRRFVRVLRTMFEVYDMYGGDQRAEEIHFKGLPGVRVVIHSFDIGSDETLQLTDYPEPDYDDIARARIVHIFKDRQESEELDWTPDESRGAPVLTGV